MTCAIWWIRRDLRLHDNPALHGALALGAVVPVFVWDPAILNSRFHHAAHARRDFLNAGLLALDAALRARGNRLLIRQGNPLHVLRELMRETNARAIFACADVSPTAQQRDAAISSELPLTLTSGIAIHRPGQVLTKEDKPYTVFTPFYRNWCQRALPAETPPTPARIPKPVRALTSLPLTSAPSFWLPAGESSALRRWAEFVAGPLQAYARSRDSLAEPGTSLLSPYFRFGMLSPRHAAEKVMQLLAESSPGTNDGVESFRKELGWRDFYLSVLHHFPAVMRQEFKPRLRQIVWRDAPAELTAWQAGETGYPIVDACMRQLRQHGWMHNRGRMIVASFLVKDLLLDWRHGEAWFMRNLLDGDPAANNGGWQWAAGVGTDAAPYFRIFNPVLQSKKYDPEGKFLRSWLPELANVPAPWIHHPWTLSSEAQRRFGAVIGVNYPPPIVVHEEVKRRTLEAYRKSP